MLRKLARHGNDWALVVDAALLDELQIDPDTPLEVTTDGQRLIVAPATDPGRSAKFAAALDETNQRYGDALRRLAEPGAR